MNQHRDGDLPEELDRILLEEDALLPSSGFALSVMDAIEEQARQPQAIPFPWKQALPGLAAFVIFVVMLVRLVPSAMRSAPVALVLPQWLNVVLSPTMRVQVGFALLVLAASWICVWVSRRMTRGIV